MSNLFRFSIFLSCFILFHCEQSSKPNKTPSVVNDTTENIDNSRLENEFIIKGTTFFPDNTIVYLFKANENSFSLVDSATVNNTRFKFKGLAETPSFYRVSVINNTNKGFTLLVDASDIHMFLNKRIEYSTTNASSTIQKNYLDYTSKMMTFKDKGISLYYNLNGNFSNKNIYKLKQDRLALFKEQNTFLNHYIKEHSNSYISVLLLKENINNFDAKTLRSLYNGLSLDIKALELSKTLDSLIFEKEAETEKTPSIVSTKKVEIKHNKEYRPKAYNISGLNPQGEEISINSIPKGKVILVDFWASWCAPCRATNLNLVALHKKYKSQGFEILSVSEDKGEADWINAISADGLSWDYHVIDKNKSIAFRYGVESIPYKILIDKNGNIASEKISGHALELRLQQLLKE